MTVIKNTIANTHTAIISNTTTSWTTIKTTISTALTEMKNKVTEVLATGINDNVWRVKNAASNLASAVDSTLGFSVPEEGPLSHADEYMPDFMKLMAEGIKKSGKVVMNAVRSLSDSMSGVFTGLSIPEINAGQLALAGAGGGGTVSNSKTINMGGLTVNVNGCNVQNDDDLADKVADRINAMLNEDDSVWGR